jgi:restriction endonuclease
MRIDLQQLPDWKEYEHLVCDALRQENPELVIERNIRIVGHLSNQRRQIDIALRGKMAGHDVLAVVDCKHYSRNIDVNDVGSFVSLLNDVGADIGILVTQLGYTKAAETMAKTSRVKLDITKLEDLREHRITIDFCNECDPGEDHVGGVINWSHPESIDGDWKKIAAVGWCDWCNTIHIKCLKCGVITGVPDVLYNEPIECLGECGTSFIVNYGDPGGVR